MKVRQRVGVKTSGTEILNRLNLNNISALIKLEAIEIIKAIDDIQGIRTQRILLFLESQPLWIKSQMISKEITSV